MGVGAVGRPRERCWKDEQDGVGSLAVCGLWVPVGGGVNQCMAGTVNASITAVVVVN
jgi:hypothetical protein